MLTQVTMKSIALTILLNVLFLQATHAVSPIEVPILIAENKNSRGQLQTLPPHVSAMLEKIERHANLRFKLQFYPWNRAVKMASEEGGLIFGLSYTLERAKLFKFSEPALYSNIWLVTQTDKKFKFSTIQDLKGKTIGVVRGSQYGGEFDAKKNHLFSIKDDVDSYELRLQQLLDNKVDAILFPSNLPKLADIEKFVNQIQVSHSTSNKNKHQFSVLPTPVLKNDLRFAIQKTKDTRIIDKINLSITLINSHNKNSKKTTTP